MRYSRELQLDPSGAGRGVGILEVSPRHLKASLSKTGQVSENGQSQRTRVTSCVMSGTRTVRVGLWRPGDQQAEEVTGYTIDT